MTNQTIEPDGRGGYEVYEWGVFERSSVLAGQNRKTYKRAFKAVSEAQEAYPQAEVLEWVRDPGNYVDHLPDWEMSARDEEAYYNPNEYP